MPTDTPTFAYGDHILVGKQVDTKTVQYDLEPLISIPFAERHKSKFHLFRQADRTTLRIAHLEEKRIPNLQLPRHRWQHSVSYTVSVKKNHDGSSNLNLYVYNKRRGLLNLTSRPELIYRNMDEGLKRLFHGEVRRLFEQNIRPWRNPTEPLPFLSDEVLYNTYPSYFTYAAHMDKQRRVFHKQLPASLMPLLRAPDTETLVQTMFGVDAPPLLYTMFEQEPSWQLLLAGHLFGRLIDADRFVGPGWGSSSVMFDHDEIKHLRTILNRCTPQVRSKLFDDYIWRTISKAPALQQPLVDLAKLCQKMQHTHTRDFPYRTIPKLTDANNFAALYATVAAHMGEQVALTEQLAKNDFETVTKQFSTLFEVANANMPGFHVSESEVSFNPMSEDLPPTYLFRLTGDLKNPVTFNPRLFGKATPLPALNGLRQVLKKITLYGTQTHEALDVNMTLPNTLLYLEDLAAALRRIAIRHRVPTDRQTITRLLYLHLYYYSLFPNRNHRNQHIKPPPVPDAMYEHVAADLPLTVSAFGVKWDIPAADMNRYRTLPPSVFKDFAHARPRVQQTHGIDPDDGF